MKNSQKRLISNFSLFLTILLHFGLCFVNYADLMKLWIALPLGAKETSGLARNRIKKFGASAFFSSHQHNFPQIVHPILSSNLLLKNAFRQILHPSGTSYLIPIDSFSHQNTSSSPRLLITRSMEACSLTMRCSFHNVSN